MALSKSAKLVTALILLVAAYLAGFLPTYLENRSLTNQVLTLKGQLDNSRESLGVTSLQNDLAQILIDAEQHNFGVARDRSTRFFDQLRQTIPNLHDEKLRQQLSAVLEHRDEITADLTAVNPESSTKLRKLFAEFPRFSQD